MNNWGGGCIISITITNNDDDYDDWKLSFELEEELASATTHVNQYVSSPVTTIDGKKVTIEVKKSDAEWSNPWAKGTIKNVPIQLSFNVIVSDIVIKNLVLNNKLITSELREKSDDTLSENKESDENNTNSNSVADENNTSEISNNTIEEENTIQENTTVENKTENKTIENSITDSSSEKNTTIENTTENLVTVEQNNIE